MKKFFLSFAKYNEEANKTIAGILNKLSNDDREKDRKSYYKSLSALYRHNLGGTAYFLSMFIDAVKDNAEALKVLEPLAKIENLTGKLNEAQWKKVVSFSKIADKALIDFINALKDKDFEAPVKIDWYKGKPPVVPLWFLLQQHVSHNIHHRGQISQILDSLKIDNDYSGINVKFL
ncbi:MAG: damage-inducible protein DinB [Treponema sp.]|nr:damage-inducible protein DinB [Treponema sp.]